MKLKSMFVRLYETQNANLIIILQSQYWLGEGDAPMI